jgi:hypothetical protein
MMLIETDLGAERQIGAYAHEYTIPASVVDIEVVLHDPARLGVELCHVLRLYLRAAPDKLGERLIDTNRTIGQANKITLIFGRKTTSNTVASCNPRSKTCTCPTRSSAATTVTTSSSNISMTT